MGDPKASQVALVLKNLPASARDVRNLGSIPGLGRSPGEENGNPLQYSCLGNPMDRGAWLATVHEVTMSQPGLSMPICKINKDLLYNIRNYIQYLIIIYNGK